MQQTVFSEIRNILGEQKPITFGIYQQLYNLLARWLSIELRQSLSLLFQVFEIYLVVEETANNCGKFSLSAFLFVYSIYFYEAIFQFHQLRQTKLVAVANIRLTVQTVRQRTQHNAAFIHIHATQSNTLKFQIQGEFQVVIFL